MAPPPPSDYSVYIDIQRKKKLSHQTTVKILYLILSCKYFLRIPTKTTFISTESWKSYHRFFCCHLLYLTIYLILRVSKSIIFILKIDQVNQNIEDLICVSLSHSIKLFFYFFLTLQTNI